MGVKRAPEIYFKTPAETKKAPMRFEKELEDAETISSVSATSSSVTPSGGSHATCTFAASGTDVNLTMAGGIAQKTFTAAATDDTFTSTSHGLSDGETVSLSKDEADNLPGGTDDTTTYYVVSSAANTFKLSKTSGGAAIDLTSDGQGKVGYDYVIYAKVTTSLSQVIDGEGLLRVRD